MNNGRVCVYIPVEEYRDLVREQRDAECLKAALLGSLDAPYSLSKEEIRALCAMFGTKKEAQEEE